MFSRIIEDVAKGWAKATRPKVGEPFNPYRRFNVLLIPEAMARSKDLLPTAKLVYGRLFRYAGKDGRCWPAVATLAEECALSERMTFKLLNNLESKGYIQRVNRFNQYRGQQSNWYLFLWHPIFDEWEDELIRRGMNSSSPSPLHRRSASPVNYSSYKESHIQEGQCEEDQWQADDGMNCGSPKERQDTGELDPVHSGSPKESHGDHVRSGPSKLTLAELGRKLKALRDSSAVVDLGDPSLYTEDVE